MNKILLTLLVSVFLLGSIHTSALAAQKEYKIFVVALEKDYSNELVSEWNPTLYCIDPVQREVINKSKLAESGVPILVKEQNHLIKVVLGYGMYDNGTSVGHQYVLIKTVDPDTMQFVEEFREEGISDKYFEKSQEMRDLETLQNEKGIPNVGLEYSKTKEKVYTLNFRDTEFLSIDIFDLVSSRFSEQLILPKERQVLRSTRPENAKLIGEDLLACLFLGNASIGNFEPGYVAIINLEDKKVDFIEIGSNPAIGMVVHQVPTLPEN